MTFDDIECDKGILVVLLLMMLLLESNHLKEMIINFYSNVQIPQLSWKSSNLEIEENYGNDLYGDLTIRDNTYITEIHFKAKCLVFLRSLQIYNIRYLRKIVIEDECFWYTTQVIFSGIIMVFQFSFTI